MEFVVGYNLASLDGGPLSRVEVQQLRGDRLMGRSAIRYTVALSEKWNQIGGWDPQKGTSGMNLESDTAIAVRRTANCVIESESAEAHAHSTRKELRRRWQLSDERTQRTQSVPLRQ